MNSFSEYYVTFRIQHDELEPSQITDMLDITPDFACKKGGHRTRVTKKGKVLELPPYPAGIWRIDSTNAKTDILDTHINSLSELLYPRSLSLAKLYDEGYTLDMMCSIFAHNCNQPGFGISPIVISKMGSLNISLQVSIYCV